MKFAVQGLTVLAIIGLAACQQTPQQQSRAPTDTGSMAYPAPQQAGVISTTRPSSSANDTGSMAYPQPQPSGTLSTTRPSTSAMPDTGSMGYQRPQPAGNYGGTRP